VFQSSDSCAILRQVMNKGSRTESWELINKLGEQRIEARERI
jgi:hypothetical protein